MEKVVVNETPIRTSRNFRINNIVLENIDLPENSNKFENVEIKKNSCEVSEVKPDVKMVYGMSRVFEENIEKNYNSSLKIVADKKDDVQIDFCFDDDNLVLSNYLEIEANSNLNVVIRYVSNTEKKCFHNGILKLNAKNGSKVNVAVINLLNNVSLNFEAIENVFEDGADVNYTIIDIGAKTSASNYYSNMVGQGSKNDLKTIYLGTDEQVKDINYIAELRGERTDINIDVQGALKNHSKKNFKGTIDFKKGCKKAVGDENEYCMLLTDDSKSIALPMLLCTEDDVEGNHSTASGKVDAEELFYIMSRGIGYNDAIKLIVKSRFNKILERITDEELRTEILDEIDRRLD